MGMTRLFGFDSHQMPFNQAKPVNKAWEDAKSIILPEIAARHVEGFTTRYNLNYNALTLLGKRYEFYLGVLREDSEIMEKYREQLGEKLLQERVAFAMQNTYGKAEDIVKKLDSMIKGFPSSCLEIELSRNPIPRVVALGDLPSDCEETGVCICRGKNKPYMSGCIDDLSLLMKNNETAIIPKLTAS